MSAKENAKQAWKEILGGTGSEQSDDQDKGNPDGSAYESQKPSMFSGASRSSDSLRPSESKTYPVSVISEGMTVNGNVSVKGDLELRGNLKGNIKGEGNILVVGKQLGNLECSKDVTLNMATVQGNINSKGTLNVDRESIVVGDVMADNAIIDGKVKGALDAKNSATFEKDAVLMGDVTADVITMSEGAQIVGKMKTKGASIPTVKFDDEFAETVEEKKIEIKMEPKAKE